MVLGLNSGTSADGLDMAAMLISRSRGAYKCEFLAGDEKEYPPRLRELVLATADSSHLKLDQIVYLDHMLGRFFGQTAARFQKRLKSKNIEIDLVASHGQTVRHLPEKISLLGFNVHGSLQLGNLEQISENMNRVVVGDFRQADIALGNEGAPITVAAMSRLLAHPSEPRLIINIGGMSNFFYFPATNQSSTAKVAIKAADCGPGNSLCDLLSQRLYKQKFDRDGSRALAGSVCGPLLKILMAAPFIGNGKNSTGREAFGLRIIGPLIATGQKLKLSSDDLMATVAEFTVTAIAARLKSIVKHEKHLSKLYLTGGGTHNKFFRQRLAQLYPTLEIGSVADLGFDPNLLEAAAYAVMGEACLHSEESRTRFDRSSRQRNLPILGKIVQPPHRN